MTGSLIKIKVVGYSYRHSTGTQTAISLDNFDFNSKKTPSKSDRHLRLQQLLLHKVPVGSMPCSSAMTSQNLAPIWFPHWPRKREMWRCTRMPQHARNWLEDASGMSEKGTRVHNTAPRRETKRLSYRAYNPISDVWPPWTCTSSRMAAGEVESERQRF